MKFADEAVPYRSLTTTIKDELYEPPKPPPPLPPETVARIRRLQDMRQQAMEPRGRLRPIVYPKLAEGQTGIPLARSAAELKPRLQGPTFEGATQTVAPPVGQAEYERLKSLDPGVPHQTDNFFKYRDPFLAGVVQPAAGRAGRAVGENIRVLPGQPAGTTPEQREQLGDIGAFAGESLIPTYAWELALTFVPGIGETRGLISAVRKGSPEAIRALRMAGTKLGQSEAVERFLKEAAGESGALRVARQAEDLGGPTGREADIPASEAASSPGQPPAVGGGPPERPPTIPEIEARSKPLTPEQRARLPRDQQEAFYAPSDFASATADVAREGTGPIGGSLQKIQDVAQKVPLIRSLFSFAEPMAGARAQKKLGNVIPEAMVRRAVYVANEREKAGVAFWKWMEDSRGTLDLDGKGVARGVKSSADIPASIRGRLDDIVEHPEDYVLSPEQERAITQLRHTFNAVTQGQLDAGVDVREVMGAYFPRIVKKSPKGAPKARALRLTSRPGHAKPREFRDLREGAAAGYEYINPIEAVQHRLDTGVESIGNRRTFEGIKELGQKPSERVPQATRDAYLQARAQYIGEAGQPSARTPENATALEVTKRNLRVAATKANEPRIGEAKAFGRIFPEEVTAEMAKYVDIDDPGALDTFFRIQRATATSSDLSALLVQGGNLFWRNNVAWWKATGYSVAALAKAPMGYVSRNIDAINRGIDAGAIRRPSEFLLREGGGAVQRVGRVPVIKQAQRSFEWFVFVGQAEWWKAAERLAKTPAERAELAAVIRKGTGSMLRPGLTKGQQRAEIGTFFAGKFLMAVNGLAADALRGGVRGAEARKTLAMVFGGATAMTIAGQLATDGTMPNLTDPSDRDKPWLSIKRPGGTVNLYGPLYPYLKAYASISQNLANGKPSAAADDALFLGRTRLSIQWGTLIDFIEGQDAVGNEIDLNNPKSVAAYFARRSAPIGAREIVEGGTKGQRDFPEGNIQALGGRASRATEFRQKLNAAERFIADSKGDYRAAYSAAVQANDTAATDGIKYQWRRDFEKRARPLGLTVTPGAYDEKTGIARAPEIEIATVNDKWRDNNYGDAFSATLGIPAKGSYNEQRDAFIEKHLPDYMKTMTVTEPVAYDALQQQFDSAPIAKSYKNAEKQDRLIFWNEHPDLLQEAWELGLEELNDDERKILTEAASR